MHVAIDGKYMGHILISDVMKSNAKASIQALKALHIKKDGYVDRRYEISCGSSCQRFRY